MKQNIDCHLLCGGFRKVPLSKHCAVVLTLIIFAAKWAEQTNISTKELLVTDVLDLLRLHETILLVNLDLNDSRLFFDFIRNLKFFFPKILKTEAFFFPKKTPNIFSKCIQMYVYKYDPTIQGAIEGIYHNKFTIFLIQIISQKSCL